MMRTISSGTILALGVVAMACSSHYGPSDGGTAGTGGTGYYGTGGTGIVGVGGTGTGTGTGRGTGGTAAGTGGTGTGGTGMMGTGGMAMMGTGGRPMTTVTCDPNVVSATMCGSMQCPAVAMGAAMCTVNCCMNNECGTQRAVMMPRNLATACRVPAMPDSRCPNETINGNMRQGCCTGNNQCGLIRNMTCTPRNQVTGAMLMPLACDETDAGH